MFTFVEKATYGKFERLIIFSTEHKESIGALKQKVPLLRRNVGYSYAPPPQQLSFEHSKNIGKLRK